MKREICSHYQLRIKKEKDAIMELKGEGGGDICPPFTPLNVRVRQNFVADLKSETFI